MRTNLQKDICKDFIKLITEDISYCVNIRIGMGNNIDPITKSVDELIEDLTDLLCDLEDGLKTKQYSFDLIRNVITPRDYNIFEDVIKLLSKKTNLSQKDYECFLEMSNPPFITIYSGLEYEE